MITTVMRIAHLIIAHKNPMQLERLIKRMQHHSFDFYIHIDKKIDIEQFLFLKKYKQVHFIEKRIKCNWGGFSTLQAMLNSLEEVLETGIEYGFYNLLSAQDYPIKTNEAIYAYFSKHADKSFIFYEPKEESNWWSEAVLRYEKYHLTESSFTGKFFVEKIINKVLPKRKFPLSLKIYGGSKASWWSLNRESAAYLVDFMNEKKELHNFLKYCWGTDEFVIPSILMNSPLKSQIVNNNLRYIDFPPGKANPRILESADLEKLISSDMLFARKFDTEVSIVVLDQIDEQLEAQQ